MAQKRAFDLLKFKLTLVILSARRFSRRAQDLELICRLHPYFELERLRLLRLVGMLIAFVNVQL
jgi:hypothetical protein